MENTWTRNLAEWLPTVATKRRTRTASQCVGETETTRCSQYTGTQTHTQTHTHTHSHKYVYYVNNMYIHMFIHIHTCIRTYRHHTYIPTYVCVSTHICIYEYMHAQFHLRKLVVRHGEHSSCTEFTSKSCH